MPVVLKIQAKRGKAPKRGIEHYWSLIMDRAVDDLTSSVSDILAGSKADRSDIRDFFKRLTKAGILEPAGVRSNGEAHFRPTLRQTNAPRVRRDGTVVPGISKQKAIWNAMRGPTCALGFTYLDIVAFAATDDTPLNSGSVTTYINMLYRAGYLIQLDKGAAGRLATWRLDPTMNTGPLPPMVLGTKVVFDQNRHEIVGDEVEAEEVKI